MDLRVHSEVTLQIILCGFSLTKLKNDIEVRKGTCATRDKLSMFKLMHIRMDKVK